MVANVSPSCVVTAASRFNSSVVSLQAIAFATAVTEAVNSHGFMVSPDALYGNCIKNVSA